MAQEIKSIDITNMPDLVRMAEAVRETREPRLLRSDGEALAVLTPVRSPRRQGTSERKAAFDAVLAAAGSWKGIVEADKLKKTIAEERGSDRSIPSQ